MDTNNNEAIFCWSGGKDSAYSLHKVLAQKVYNVKYLLTTVNENYDRVSIHGVREDLLEKQTKSIGIPLIKVKVKEGSNNEYEEKMKSTLLKIKEEGINNVIFGDIFLEDLRKYREENLAKVGMVGIFPIWKKDTSSIVRNFIDEGFKSIICCINSKFFNESWVGRIIDNSFLTDLPKNVDPCGENGEYHSFCFDGPIFQNKISIKVGEKRYFEFEDRSNSEKSQKHGFWFCDLLEEN